jgi:hypothetical protein
MDRRLLERTVEFALKRGDFDPNKLPKDLRVAMDSMPMEGAGGLADTLAHLSQRKGRRADQPLRPAALLRHQKLGDVAAARDRASHVAEDFKPFVALARLLPHQETTVSQPGSRRVGARRPAPKTNRAIARRLSR